MVRWELYCIFIARIINETIEIMDKGIKLNQSIKLEEHVVLIDTAFLNFMLLNLKGFLEGQIKRSLPDLSLADLLACLALDAGIPAGEKKIQVVLISDDENKKLHHTVPSHLENELDGVAFDSSLGEFLFASTFTEGVVSRGELFLDVLTIALESKDVKNLVLLSFDDEYGDKVLEKINKKEIDKGIMQFRMREPQGNVHFKWDMLVFPMMKAFGVDSDEIK